MQDMVGSCKEIKNLLEKSFQKIKISHQSKKQLAKKKKCLTKLLFQSISKSNYCFKIAFLIYQKIAPQERNGPTRCTILEESPGYTFHMYTSLLNPLCIHLNSIKLADL